MKNYLLIIFNILGFTIFAQHQVDPFTGSLSYSMDVMQIPTRDGDYVPIRVSYGSGIMVNQPASEIGLGWGLIAGGSISRSVVGTPDDWKNKQVLSEKTGQQRTQNGILYSNPR